MWLASLFPSERLNLDVKGAPGIFVLLQDVLSFRIRAVGWVGSLKYIRTFKKGLN